MEPKTSMSDARTGRAFYLPATAAVRRIERAVSSAVRDRSRLVRGRVPVEQPRAFYMPAMAVISTGPSRVERFVRSRLENRGIATRASATAERAREFSLPAVLRR